jgi:hypothetical protein
MKTGGKVSDGSTAEYYELPPGAKELQDLISYKNMNGQIAEIFRTGYRYGETSHSDMLRDAKKIRFYINAEIKRLETYILMNKVFGEEGKQEAAPEITLDDLRQLMQEFLSSNERNRWLYFNGGKVYVRKSLRMIAGESMPVLDIANISVDMQRQGHGTVVVNALHNAHFYPATYIENVMVEGWAGSLERNGWVPHGRYQEEALMRSFYKRR